MSSRSTRYAPNVATRCAFSSSLPIDTQVSVTTTSAPAPPRRHPMYSVTDPPVSAAMRSASATTDAAGANSSGEATRTCMPAVAPASTYDCAMFQAPSPRNVDGEAGEVALVLPDGEQVGEELARVEVVGERVDDGHGGARRHLLEAGLAVGAPDDRRDHALEHPRRVGRRLLAAELAVRRGDDERRRRRGRRCRPRTTPACASTTCRR